MNDDFPFLCLMISHDVLLLYIYIYIYTNLINEFQRTRSCFSQDNSMIVIPRNKILRNTWDTSLQPNESTIHTFIIYLEYSKIKPMGVSVT